MVSAKTAPRPTATETQKILADTAQAVKVMKASWLHVALNLKRIREHELWREATPACGSYEEYVFDVLKLNKYVARRMLDAMEYTETHRPKLIEDFRTRGTDVDIPSYDVVNKLRRVERSFDGRDREIDELRSQVFDEGVGRVVLEREIDRKLGKMDTGAKVARDGASKADERVSLGQIIDELMQIESRLLELKVSKEAQKLAFELVEALQKEKQRRDGEKAQPKMPAGR